MVAAPFAVLFFLTAFVLVALGLVALVADAIERDRQRARREGWREHRAFMDSLEPRKWVRP